MNKAVLFLSILALVAAGISCNNQGPTKELPQAISTAEVNIYYFHFTRRCATCLAVEENAQKAIVALYPNELKAGEYSFTSLNLDEAASKEIAEKLGVGGQSLIVVRGGKKIDITSAAWLSAHDTASMQAEIKSGIEKVLY
jgi:hypothetical protein